MVIYFTGYLSFNVQSSDENNEKDLSFLFLPNIPQTFNLINYAFAN